MINTKSHKELFTKDEQWNRSPNIDEIKKFYAGKNKEVTGIFPSQTYEPSGELTGFARNKGEHAGQFKDIDKLKTAGLWILIKDETGKLTLSHTDEINNRTTIPNDKDIITLPSVKRNGKFNEDLLGKSDIAHFIVQKKWGSTELITTYGNKDAQKKALENPDYERVLYLDVRWNNDQLNGYRTQKNGKLEYGHHTNGDILNNATTPKEVVKGNMPALIIMTKDKPSS